MSEVPDIPGLPEGLTVSGGPPVSLPFFCGALEALGRANGNRSLGDGDEAEQIRGLLGRIEEIYRRLPEVAPPPGPRAEEFERLADMVERMRVEAHDYGLEAFPAGFWDSCELIEATLRAAAEDARGQE